MRKLRNGNLAVFLTLLFLLPIFVTFMPQREANAYVFSGEGNGICVFPSSKPLTVEVNQKFYAGDFISSRKGMNYSLLSTPSAVTFSRYAVSRNKEGQTAIFSTSKYKVASVNPYTGFVTTKTPGNCVITYKTRYNGDVQIHLSVVEAGALGSTTTYKALNTAAAKLTVANAEKRQANIRSYLKLFNKYKDSIQMTGCLREYPVNNLYPVPMAARIGYYLMEYYPFTGVVGSASASTNSFRERYQTVGITASAANNYIILELDKAIQKSTVKWAYAFDTSAKLTDSDKTITLKEIKFPIRKAKESNNWTTSPYVTVKMTIGSKKIYLYPMIWSEGKYVKAKISKGDVFSFSIEENPIFLWFSFGAKGMAPIVEAS